MDGELFRRLYHLCVGVASREAGRRRTYSDLEVLVTFVLAAVANRPLSWACRRGNRPPWCLRLKVPTPSTMSRRTRTPQFRRLLLALDAALRGRLPGSSLKFLDGKPLLVAGHSGDRDARTGRAPGGFAQGYRLHALLDACGRVEAFTVTGLGGGESTAARELLVPAADLRGALVLGDPNYDSNPLYAAVSAAGGRLLAPRRKPGTGFGHGTEQHPDRLRAVDELERTAGGRAAGVPAAAAGGGAGVRAHDAPGPGGAAAVGPAAPARADVGDGQGARLPRPPPPTGRQARGVDAKGYPGRGQG
jgi:hypothetical protein